MKKRKKEEELSVSPVQTAARGMASISSVFAQYPENADTRLFSSVRQGVPIISAAVDKIIRLVGDFKVKCDSDQNLENALSHFTDEVRCGASEYGLCNFISSYLDCLLTKGTAVGEIVLNSTGDGIGALYNADLNDVSFKRGDNPFDITVCRNSSDQKIPIEYQRLILHSALRPEGGSVTGRSLLTGVPEMADILMKIYRCIGNNFERMGNLRYAVTYKGEDDRVNPSARAEEIAKQWATAMAPNTLRDFVAVGDVEVKVIGADAQPLSTEIPVKQLLEQIIAKTGIPPFMLGLSWSSTERMSAQQADTLTSELEYYRRLLNPVILKICNLWQNFEGRNERLYVEWSHVNLQDEVELARARLYNAQADKLIGGQNE